MALLIGELVVAAGVVDAYQFESAEQEARYQSLIAEFRCPKCLNTNLAGSDSPIASDLRREIQRLVREGQSDTTIADFLQSRYGDFVLYDPPFRLDTWFLWLGPAVVLILGFFILHGFLKTKATPMSEQERSDLDTLLSERLPSESDSSSTLTGTAAGPRPPSGN